MNLPAVAPSTWRYGAGFAVWGAAVLGTLQIHRVPGDFGHGICGPWGCGPPTQALVSYHGFWLMLFLPPTLAFHGQLSLRALKQVGLGLIAIGLLSLVGIVAWEAFDWLSNASEQRRGYVVQRCLFVVLTLVDVPLVQLTLTGITCLVIARVRGRSSVEEPDEPDSAQFELPQASGTEMAESISSR